MTPEQQRIAIAEACPFVSDNDGYETGFAWYHNGAYEEFDPLNDLNAMHEAEKVLNSLQQERYRSLLDELTAITRTPKHHATASQRADAFIATLGLDKH